MRVVDLLRCLILLHVGIAVAVAILIIRSQQGYINRARTWSRLWKERAKTYRSRARASQEGHRQALRDIRLFQAQLEAALDARPLEVGPELDAYVTDLRQRNDIQFMYIVELETRLGIQP